MAANLDPNLVNPWGISFSPSGPFWISDNNAGVSSLYNGQGKPQSLVVSIPPPAGSPAGSAGTPTGTVFNGTAAFTVTANSKSGSSIFLFATEDGTIAGWSPSVDTTHAVIAVDNSANPTASTGAVYKGLALGADSGGHPLLYAANFRAGTVDVFDASFHPTLAGSFADPSIPSGFAPFDVQALGPTVYVTYAKQNAVKHDDVSGPGNGYVDAFDMTGHLLRRVASQGPLNSPWGLALAPSSFGRFGSDLLVGNFGDGLINAYNPSTGAFLGELHDPRDRPIAIDGLWGLAFGNGGSAGPADTLFFTAGIEGEQHGLFGSLQAIAGADTRTLTTVTGSNGTVTFALATDDSLFRHDDVGGWKKLGDSYQSISAVVENSGNVVLFAVRNDHALFSLDSLSGLKMLGDPGTVQSISAGVDSNGRAVAFVLRTDTALIEFRNASGWLTSPIGAAGTILGFSAAAHDQVAVVTADHSVFTFDPVLGWQRLSPAAFAQSVSAVTDRTGNQVVFAVTQDKGLMRHDANGWTTLGAAGTIESIDAGLDASGQANVFVLTATTDFVEFSNGSGWQKLGASGTIRTFSAAGQSRVLVVTADHSVFEHDDAIGWFPLTSSGFGRG